MHKTPPKVQLLLMEESPQNRKAGKPRLKLCLLLPSLLQVIDAAVRSLEQDSAWVRQSMFSFTSMHVELLFRKCSKSNYPWYTPGLQFFLGEVMVLGSCLGQIPLRERTGKKQSGMLCFNWDWSEWLSPLTLTVGETNKTCQSRRLTFDMADLTILKRPHPGNKRIHDLLGLNWVVAPFHFFSFRVRFCL